ncbi:MAG TPA: UDP-N-acetylglucosamine 2-epimerase (non-hydrolyzing) [Gaiellaceae bacterium]|nr:UDP-N-acetylglucosamine 2-epimerase (non-hydrolyzing) [Gaiellaceae bacterium]
MRVLSVVGNRPQFVKSGPLSVALRNRGIDEVVVHTGQHYDRELSAVFFDELGLPPPAHSLDLKTADVGRLTPAIADVVAGERPDRVLVYGDTNSTLAGARAAGETPVAHVEAGLRSGDLSMPEEHNRIEVDRLSSLLFTPDERSRDVLEAEGVTGRIDVVGDVMADANMRFAPLARERSTILADLGLEPGAYAVATVHREANVRPDRLARIADGLSRLGERVIFPAHPRTRAALASNTVLLGSNVALIDPLGYMDFAALASQARVILTDSGGLQKEAYWYGVPCVTLRPSTEWKDTVELGANVLVDDDPQAIANAAAEARMPPNRPVLYGDGHAADRIAEILISL